MGVGGGLFHHIFGMGVRQTIQNVTQQDLITTKNEKSMGSEPVKFGVNRI